MTVYKAQRPHNYTMHEGWFGGKFDIPNQSTAYHGLLKQWWERYKAENAKWLLISEKNRVKPYFQSLYPTDSFFTLEKYAESDEVDFNFDLCQRDLDKTIEDRFDVVLCQATLEHVYAPFNAVSNMLGLLNKNGILLMHTHTPPFHYHASPKDYIRYFPDWFLDIPEHFESVQLLELFDTDGGHIFSMYKKF